MSVGAIRTRASLQTTYSPLATVRDVIYVRVHTLVRVSFAFFDTRIVRAALNLAVHDEYSAVT